VLESKWTESAALPRTSTLFFFTCCPRRSSPRHAARSSASAAQGWKSREAVSISERAVAVVKLTWPILVAPEVSTKEASLA